MKIADIIGLTSSIRNGNEELDSDEQHKRKAIIIDADPAFLAMALELLTRKNMVPIILEESCIIGGEFMTRKYNVNLIDIAKCHFSSKSNGVSNWLLNKSMATLENGDHIKSIVCSGMAHRSTKYSPPLDETILSHQKLSRVFGLQSFINYPLWFFGIVQTVRLDHPNYIWIGVEYRCFKDDSFWHQNDDVINGIAIQELELMGIAKRKYLLNTIVFSNEKIFPTYPES